MAKQLGAVCGACGGRVQMVSAFCHHCGHGFSPSSSAPATVPAVVGAGARASAGASAPESARASAARESARAAASRSALMDLVAQPTVALPRPAADGEVLDLTARVPRPSELEELRALDGPATAEVPGPVPAQRLVPVSPRRVPPAAPEAEASVETLLEGAPGAQPDLDAADGPARRRVVPLVAAGALVVVGAVVAAGLAVRPGPDAAAPTAAPGTSAGAGAAPAGTSWTASAQAQAPSTSPDSKDAAGHTTSYAAPLVLDGDPATAWRMNGDGAGTVLTFALDGVHPVRSLGLVNGYAKVDPASGADRYAQERRITRVTWIVDGHEHRQELRDGERGVQRLTIPADTASRVQLRIDATTGPGSTAFDKTAISDVTISG